MADADHPLIASLGDELVDATWLRCPRFAVVPTSPGVRVAYTAMHGVGGAVGAAGLRGRRSPTPTPSWPTVRARRHVPDGLVPEPGGAGCDGPADRPTPRRVDAQWRSPTTPTPTVSAAAIPQPDGSWRRLGGDEIGWLFADYLLANTTVTTGSWSPRWCRRRCSARWRPPRRARAETFTGFKWIARAVLDRPELEFVLGYEQALGYLVASNPLDKDGITAAVLFAEMAAVAAADGRTLQEWLDDIAARYGRHVLADASVRMTPADAAAKVAALRAEPPTRSVGGRGAQHARSIPRPTCCASSSTVACACRSVRAAPSRRSSSTARPSTRTRRRSSPRSRRCSAETTRTASCATPLRTVLAVPGVRW